MSRTAHVVSTVPSTPVDLSFSGLSDWNLGELPLAVSGTFEVETEGFSSDPWVVDAVPPEGFARRGFLVDACCLGPGDTFPDPPNFSLSFAATNAFAKASALALRTGSLICFTMSGSVILDCALESDDGNGRLKDFERGAYLCLSLSCCPGEALYITQEK